MLGQRSNSEELKVAAAAVCVVSACLLQLFWLLSGMFQYNILLVMVDSVKAPCFQAVLLLDPNCWKLLQGRIIARGLFKLIF